MVQHCLGQRQLCDAWQQCLPLHGNMVQHCLGQRQLHMSPFFDHTLLRARAERKVSFDHLEYTSKPNLIIPPPGTCTLYAIAAPEISDKQVDALKLRCSDTVGARVSAFRVITALAWRCASMTRKLDTEAESRLYTMIDMRNRMSPPLPPTYFGNAVVRTSVTAVVGDIIASPLSHVAKKVHAATKMGNDYARSLIDHLEAFDLGKPPQSGVVPASELRVISWLGMPTLGGENRYFSHLLTTMGMFYIMDSIRKDADVTVVVSLEPENLPAFEKLFMEELAALDV